MKKNLYLIGGILSILVFIGYLGEPGPYKLLGLEMNIWIIRIVWLLIAAMNFKNYFNIRESEKLKS